MAKDAVARALELVKKYSKTDAPVPEIDEEALRNEIATEQELREARAAEAQSSELVLKSLHYRHQLMMKTCRWCKATFSTNYCSVSLCSVSCRKAEFREKYGIRYNAIQAPSLFEYEPAAVIPPASLASLYEYCVGFVREYERVENEAKMNGPDENPLRVRKQAITIGPLGQSVTEEELRGMLIHQEGSFEPIIIPQSANPDPEITRLKTERGYVLPPQTAASPDQSQPAEHQETPQQIPHSEELRDAPTIPPATLDESTQFEIPDFSF